MEKEKHLQNFINETEDLLRSLNEKLSAVVVGADNAEYLSEIFRVAHTIKGNASFFGFVNLKIVAHALEDLLSEIRSGNLKIDKTVIDLLWNGANLLSLKMEHVKEGKVVSDLSSEGQAFLTDVKKMLSERSAVPKIISSNYRVSDSIGYLCGDIDVTRPIYVLKVFLEKAREKSLDGEMSDKFIATLQNLSEIFLKKGYRQSVEAAKKIILDFQALIGDDGQADDLLCDRLEAGFKEFGPAMREVEIRDVMSAWREVRLPAEKIKPTFRIEKEKIDEILAVVRRLDPVKKDFENIRDKMVKAGAEGSLLLEFQKIINSLNFFSRDLLQMLVKIKVTSPRLLLEKMEQIVLSLAQSCSKKIKIHTAGKDIFVDRSKIEVLEKVMPHIVRNCIDHGIELPHERLNLGKPEEGLISIEAVKQEDELTISISDDGRGIDFKALRKTEDNNKNVFTAGVSTRAQVGELSGRGVGMDVVLHTLEKAGGEIEVFSEAGKGTKFVITLPDEVVKE